MPSARWILCSKISEAFLPALESRIWSTIQLALFHAHAVYSLSFCAWLLWTLQKVIYSIAELPLLSFQRLAPIYIYAPRPPTGVIKWHQFHRRVIQGVTQNPCMKAVPSSFTTPKALQNGQFKFADLWKFGRLETEHHLVYQRILYWVLGGEEMYKCFVSNF